MSIKLQLALDTLNPEEAIQLAQATQDHIDIIEIGTPLIKHEGISLVKKMRKLFPDKSLLVDLKTMDAGEYETGFCFAEGVDIVTVLGVADLKTIEGAIKGARNYDAKVMVDLINVPNKVERAKQAESIGADILGIHSGIDQQMQGASPLSDLQALMGEVSAAISVAGGITLDTVAAIANLKPAIVVVGGGITGKDDPAQAAKAIKEVLL